MMSFGLCGVYPAMTTPFHEDDSIDFEQFRVDVWCLEEAGVSGVIPIGSTDESATPTHDERVEAVKAAVEAVEKVPVVAGSGSNSTREALELSRRSADTGADALLLISLYYNRPKQAGLVDHYRTIADEIGLLQIVYNIPGRTGSSILSETAVTLVKHPNITGYKTASGDLDQISEAVERTRDEQFAVLSGGNALTLPMLSVDDVGVTSVMTNVESACVGVVVHSAPQGGCEHARNIHHDLAPLNHHLFSETNPAPVKEAMEIRGYGPTRLCSPLIRLTEEDTEKLRRLLSDPEAEQAILDGGAGE